ncbi:MAG: hypothetical protein H7175_10785, partial [Burkholderiales bacterium]|nr:hypothetical protein [Anaerolineae bacterium]
MAQAYIVSGPPLPETFAGSSYQIIHLPDDAGLALAWLSDDLSDYNINAPCEGNREQTGWFLLLKPEAGELKVIFANSACYNLPLDEMLTPNARTITTGTAVEVNGNDVLEQYVWSRDEQRYDLTGAALEYWAEYFGTSTAERCRSDVQIALPQLWRAIYQGTLNSERFDKLDSTLKWDFPELEPDLVSPRQYARASALEWLNR